MSVNRNNNQSLIYAPISYIGEEPLEINKPPIVDVETDLNNRLDKLVRSIQFQPATTSAKGPLLTTPIVDRDPESIALSERFNALVRSIRSEPATTSAKGPLLGKVNKDVSALVALHKRYLIAERNNVKPFPNRTIAIAQRVGKLSTDKLLALSTNSFMQIVDLIGKKQAEHLLSDPRLPLVRRSALRTFNPHVQK